MITLKINTCKDKEDKKICSINLNLISVHIDSFLHLHLLLEQQFLDAPFKINNIYL